LANYTGPKCKLCRREGVKLFLKGRKCVTKCIIEKRAYVPGQHGQKPSKASDYAIHLREKQKVRRIYGIMEKQFRKYFYSAQRQKGVTGENLLRILERRLDNTVFRMGFSYSRKDARQFVRHGHILVNDKKVDIPSYLVKIGDVVRVKGNSETINKKVKECIEIAKDRSVPSWLGVDGANIIGIVKALPSREDVGLPIQDHLIVEFYSK
jgi:small subunit ribosomal protein S4